MFARGISTNQMSGSESLTFSNTCSLKGRRDVVLATGDLAEMAAEADLGDVEIGDDDSLADADIGDDV